MKVTVLTVWNSDTANSTIAYHTTPQGAFQELANWVEGRWDQERLGRSIDDDSFDNDDDRVVYFFDTLGEDYQYDIEEKNVYGPTVADPDEVHLNPEEIRATILAIECANIHEMAEGLGTNPARARDLAHGVTRKLRA